MKEIGKEFRGLGKIAASQIFTPKLMGGLADLLKELTPLIKETAAWIGGLGQSFVDAATGPGAQQFITFLSRTIPRLLNMWKPILGNLATFFGELFMGSIPLAKDFLGWLSGITKELADWGKGGKGSGLSKFLDQAQTSMHAVGHALAPLVGLIGDLLFNPTIAKQGDQMWKQIGDSIQRVRDWLRKAQKDGSLKSFFDDSKQFAEALGGIIGQVIRLVRILSKPEVRKSVVIIAKAFYVVIRAVVDLVGQVVWAYGKIWSWSVKVWNFIRTEGPKAWHAVQRAWSNAGSWFSNKWHAILQSFVSTWHGITHAASVAWHAISTGASNMASAIANFIIHMGNRIQSIWNTVTGAIKSGISTAASFVSNKVGDIVNWIQGIPGKIGNVGSDIYHHIYDALKSLPGDIVSLFTGLGQKILNAIGSINISSLIHGPAALLHKVGLAQGGIVLGPMSPLIGERGPEAVVPLTGPLNQVDPAVRALSEIARQMYGGGGQTAPAPAPAGRTIDIGGIVIQGSTADPKAVATQVVNRIAAATYL
jgi:phage-related protein